MAGLVSKYNGLVARHPVYGDGVVIGEDKYSRLIIKLAGGHQVNSILPHNVKFLSEDEVFKTDVFKRLSATGMVNYIRTPYTEGAKSLAEAEAGPWACKTCGQTFDPDLPQINFDKGEKGFSQRKDLVCPMCGSTDVKYLADPDDKADMYMNPARTTDYHHSEYAPKQKFSNESVDLPAVRILESLMSDMALSESSLGYSVASVGKIGTDGIRNFIKQKILKREDLFQSPDFLKGKESTWNEAVDIVIKSGKVLDNSNRLNYSGIVNVWKNLYKNECGNYPESSLVEALDNYFGRQKLKIEKVIGEMSTAMNVHGKTERIINRKYDRNDAYLQGLVSEIEGIRERIVEDDSIDAVSKIDEIIDKLSEDNPWHDKGGRFPKGGHKRAKMWSLYGKRHSVAMAKGGMVKFRKLSKKRVSGIRQWRKTWGPHPDIKSSHKPPYRSKGNR
jgi:rubredoxin